jgi:hypothetical protein
MSRWIGLLLAAWLCQGCATLRIQVDLYKPPLPQSAAAAQQLANRVLAEPTFEPVELKRYLDTLATTIADLVKKGNCVVYEKQFRPDPEGDARTVGDRARQDLLVEGEEVENRAARLVTRASEIRALAGATTEDQNKRYLALREDLAGYLAAVRDFADKAVFLGNKSGMEREILSQLLAADRDLSVSARAIATSSRVDGRAVGTPIFDDRIALLEQDSGKDDSRWAEFGRLRFAAHGGNAQFVVVREGLLVFTQKSLDFDPTPVIGAGEALAKTGLRVAAALASGKVSTLGGGGQGEGSGQQPATPETVVNEAKLEADQEALANRRAARRELLTGLASLLGQADGLQTSGVTDEGLKQLWSELTSQLANYRGRVAAQEGEP